MDLIAYPNYTSYKMPIVPAEKSRDWMDKTENRHAYKCLPMVLANQAGWHILSPQSIHIEWNGKPLLKDLKVSKISGEGHFPCAMSNFGHGIVTFIIPYLFRTPPGWDLLVKGPANHPKDGVCPLEGLVETDWSVAHFTMNWKLTRPGSISFDMGEPVCQIVPQKRRILELFMPWIQAMPEDLLKEHEAFMASRRQFNEEQMRNPTGEWQKHYFQGKKPDGTEFHEHQAKLNIRKFVEK